MSFFAMLEAVFIGPLKLVFEIIFDIADRFIGHPGLAIIVLSLIMNILVLPLYKRADAMQEAARDTEAKLQKGVSHIKKTFSGDERMMILQTYYRQNNYKPTSALNGSISLLLEIPFFMAAYQFLSHLDILNGVSLGPIADLGAPDGLIVIGSLSINLLPILMTLVNIVSSSLYLKGFPLKTKIQLYAMALFFLVFLYTSPACLVFYWTLNNVFSLVKNIFYKLKNPKKVIGILTSVVGLLLIACGLFFYSNPSVIRKAFLCGVGLIMQLPLIMPLFIRSAKHAPRAVSPNRKFFVLGALFLTILIGLLIPSTYIAASPQEYIDVSYFHNPMGYVINSLCLAAGTFLVWLGVFYWLASPRGKVIFEKLVWILCGVMMVNYMFFGTNLGVISSTLQYENGMSFSLQSQLINLLVLAVIAGAMYLLSKKWKSVVAMALITAIVGVSGMSAINVVTINRSVAQIEQSEESQAIPSLNLNKDGQNVVVIMLDRALGAVVPYILNEKPELKETFAGFTYYSNTISFGGHTNFGLPALVGGYEYTPVEMNKRSDETLVTKHNEALKVLPKLFSDNEYQVTICDPAYAGYQWIPDLSIYDDIPNVSAYITKGKFGDIEQKKSTVENTRRNFFCFSLMKSMPLFLQTTLYNDGQYNQAIDFSSADESSSSTATALSTSESTGLSTSFAEAYNVLTNLANITTISEGSQNTFLFLANDTAHDPTLLQAPDYVPSVYVNNYEYDAANTDRFTVDGITLDTSTTLGMMHYHCNMAALLRLGDWFDYLRQNAVYDNTRIIIVADHGHMLNQIEQLVMGNDKQTDAMYYFPLLMVKDFNSQEFTVSDEFMTNADVPTLATDDLIENPVNPYTGNPINSDEKTAHEQLIIISEDWNVSNPNNPLVPINNGTTYLPARWASVKDDIWNKDNWTFTYKMTVEDDHSLNDGE